jgi:hypothetical protein
MSYRAAETGLNSIFGEFLKCVSNKKSNLYKKYMLLFLIALKNDFFAFSNFHFEKFVVCSFFNFMKSVKEENFSLKKFQKHKFTCYN